MENLNRYGAARRLVAVAAIAAMAATPCAHAQDAGLTRTLTLRDVFQQVEGANPGIAAGKAGLQASQEQTRQMLAKLLPQVRASAEQSRQHITLAGTQFSDLASDPSAGAFFTIPEHYDTFNAGVSVSIPVVDARKLADWKAAQLEEKAAKLQQVTTVQDTLAQAAELYFTHLRNLSRLEVLRKDIERDQVLLDVANQRRSAGVATELDVTRASAAIARDRQQLLAAQTQATQTRLALLQVMNLPPTTRLELVSEQPVAPQADSLPATDSVVNARPEFEAAQALLKRNQVAERAASWQRFPNVSLVGNYGFQMDTPDNFNRKTDDVWMLGISLSVPIWEGGRIHSEKKQAHALVRQQEHLITGIENKISSDYILAKETVEKRWEELPLAREAVSLSEQELQYARQRFEAGVADNSDVVIAQASLAQASDAEVETLFRYHLARITLARTMGHVAEQLAR